MTFQRSVISSHIATARARSDRRARALAFLVALAVVLLLAQSPTPQARAQGSRGNLDVVLVIDNSGSMGDNDPDGLRWSAAQLFVDLAAPGDRVAAVAFAAEVEPLGDAARGQLTPMGDQQSRDGLKRVLAPREPEGGTNMEAALLEAEDLLSTGDVGNERVIVFLTDGKPDPEDQRPGLTEAIREAGRRGVMVFPILLGSGTDPDVADQMVRDTGSIRQDATDALELLQAFGSVYAHVQPERYVDQLNLKPLTTLTFQTNAGQSITEAVVVIPRQAESDTALSGLTLNGQEVLTQSKLSNGASVVTTAARHYQLVKVTHNVPLDGEWNLSLGNAQGTGLLIVQSQVVLDLLYPVTSRPGSFVAPRVVPRGKEVLLAGQLLRAGSRVGDAQVSVVFAGDSLSLNSGGLSANRSIYWEFVDIGDQQAGSLVPVELQVGLELTPFRLRKQFVLEPADVPALVVDSPSPTDSGLRARGRLRIAVHFDRDGVSHPSVVAYVWDQFSDSVFEIDLSCTNQGCQDENLEAEPGRAYQVLVVGQAGYDGRRFTDAALTSFATGDVVRVDGMEAVRDLGVLTSDKRALSVPLDITAFTQAGQPQLRVRLENLTPRPSEVSISADLSPLTPAGSNCYRSELTFRRLHTLPPDHYTVDVVFEAADARVSPSVTTISFEVPHSLLQLTEMTPPVEPSGCPGPSRESQPVNLVDFGVLFGETARVDLLLEGLWIEGIPRVDSQVTSLHQVGRPQSVVEPVQLRTGSLEPVGGDYRLPLTLELPEDLPPGRYAGAFELSSPQASVEPATYEFLFYKPGFLGRVYQRLRPARCFLIDWYALAPPFPRPRGLFCWGVTLLVAMVAIATVRAARGTEGRGRVQPGYDSPAMALSAQRPVYVVMDPGDPTRPPRLSQRREDVGRAVAEVWMGEPDSQGRERATLLPGAARGEIRLYYYSPRRRRWRRVRQRGIRLRTSGRFRVRRADQRYDFTVEL